MPGGEAKIIKVTKRIFISMLVSLLVMFPCSINYAEPVQHHQETCCTEEFNDILLVDPFKKSSVVEEVQKALLMTGYYFGEITGNYNEMTVNAVKAFQKEIGLATDGMVRYHVWLKLAAEAEKVMAKKTLLPPPSGEVSIVIDTFKRRLVVLNNGIPYAQFPVAIGKAETPSPIGNWKVTSKAVNWGTGFGTRWMGLNVPWGVYGIHGTNKPWSIGSMASHGCFRMWNKDIEIIFPWIKYGTSVTVIGNPFGYMSGGIKRLNQGDCGADVWFIQEKLWRRGFYQGKPDGKYGYGTVKAVIEFQKSHGLPPTGQIGYKEYELLGIKY